MQFDPLNPRHIDEYEFFARSLVPRPIAWVSTVSSDRIPNLAPFSFFGAVCGEPPIVSLGIGRRNGMHKDTARNLMATGEAVIHVPHRPLVESMVRTSAEVGPEVDEFELAGLRKLPSVKVRPPRVDGAALAFECCVERHIELGEGPTDLFLLRIVYYHALDEVLDAHSLPEPSRLVAIGRLGGDEYCTVTEVFTRSRPRLPG